MRQTDNPSYIDLPLLTVVLMLCALSLIVLYSATGENLEQLVRRSIHVGFALAVMLVFTRIRTSILLRWSPNVYAVGLGLLFMVLAIGVIGKGAQRWIDLSVFRFQPAEMMKIAVPMMVAWTVARSTLPPNPLFIILSIFIVLIPTALVILQPDLGTGLLIALTGIMMIFLAGIGWKFIVTALLSLAVIVPAMWVFVLHDYQRSRVFTLFDPWADPLGVGYHIIQSIIAIGSGGVQGKGWLSGTQSQLEFIPEQRTDFIFAVYAEEFGLIGVIVLLMLYLFLVFRGLLIAFHARDTYSRLLAGGLSTTFFFYVFVNIGMVSGILPVVGIPLPLMSYGGTSMVTLMIGLGILMSIARDSKSRGWRR
ncbi:rod shape-determining protein RodA [Candidatus Spongiihabitans sp.]|uniref:rod shape-determining protein RodA n=1 Tax=Candidatus Spongiihabitans sp. TaxID=3101308 RepID=UPI003C6F599E